MGATVFVQPLDLVKNRMQLSGKQTLFTLNRESVLLFCTGEGGAVRQHKTSLHAIGRVISEEGLLGLYNGYVHLLSVCIVVKVCACANSLSAGLLRQATYSTTRLGVYQSLFDKFSG